MDEKLAFLVRMHELQVECLRLLIEAEAAKARNDLNTAAQAYDRLIEASEAHLQVATEHNLRCEKPVEVVPIVRSLVNALLIAADIQEASGSLETGEAFRNKASALTRHHLGEPDMAEAERSPAASLVAHGRFNEALVALAMAMDQFELERDEISCARTSMDRADVLQWLGDYERALAELERVSQRIERLTSHASKAQAGGRASPTDATAEFLRAAEDTVALYRITVELDYYRGLISRYVGRWDDAETNLRKVLPHYERLGDGPAIHYQLASVLVGRGEVEAALQYAMRLEPGFTTQGLLRPKLAGLLKLKAEALLALGREDEALTALEIGIRDLATYYDPDLLWRLQWLKGRCLAATTQNEKALGAFAEAANTVNGLRRAPLGYRLDSTFLRDKVGLFADAINLACETGAAEECCRLIEMVKSRALAAVLGTSRSAGSRAPGELEARFDDVSRELDALEYRAYRGKAGSALQDKRDALLRERSELLERIRYSDPRWRHLTKPAPIDLPRTMETLADRRQAVLSLYYEPDRIVAVLLKDRNATAAATDIPPTVRERLGEYVRNLQAGDKADRTFFDLSASLAVGARHLTPVELLLAAVQSDGLIIVPHGSLHLVPWAGLVLNGKRLFEYCPVGMLPSLSCICTLGASSETARVAIVGPPSYIGCPSLQGLPAARAEAEAIRQLYEDEGKIAGNNVLVGPAATERAFWELADRGAEGAILHFICHGVLQPDDPMNSGLLLEDGKVDAAEIARSPLRYDEVILSACSTGWRPMEVQGLPLLGDDILGLPGAFLEAGAKSVLVSIPPANDAAAFRFMVLYHESRLNGNRPLRALQNAQQSMLSESKHAPWAWLGFTLYGCS